MKNNNLSSKIDFVPSKDAYDGKKLNQYTLDEYGQIDSTGKIFKIGKIFYLHYKKHFFWFRFFGSYGIWGRGQKMKAFELFSERYGYTKYLKILGWKFKLLKPSKPNQL